ncbi:SIS domain-containing protein [Myxococcota bacterium]|mgnify:CR=1 FL=1|nr:SIS domain-containing protein [Myxococcota bacterium]
MSEALSTFDVVLAELRSLREVLSEQHFEKVLAVIAEMDSLGGRLHVTGIGKSEHVARYAAALFASTGTPASFLAGVEAGHGSSGQIVPGDVVIAISNSGETEELRLAITAVRGLGAKVIAITGNSESWLAKNAEAFLSAAVEKEGGGLGLAPRASAAAQTVVLASLSAELEVARNFNRQDFHARHPAGALGRETKA